MVNMLIVQGKDMFNRNEVEERWKGEKMRQPHGERMFVTLVKRWKRKKNIQRAASGSLLSFAAHLGNGGVVVAQKNMQQPFRLASGGGGMVRNTKYI